MARRCRGGAQGSAITVMASDSQDRFASFSNWGTCSDIIAPGVSITAAYLPGSFRTRATLPLLLLLLLAERLPHMASS